MITVYSPIIIVGMHRSGTSLVSEILEKLGLFIGAYKDQDQESLFFLQINNWLLKECGGSWRNVDAIDRILLDPGFQIPATDYLTFLLKTPQIIRYLGWRHYLKYHGIAHLDQSWGWKDPRSTITLPIWLNLFPDARVVHIYRNGVDVANSLRVRSLSEVRKRWMDWDGRVIYNLSNRKPKLHPERIITLEEGFHLWELYIQRAQKHMRNLDQNCTLSICYEDFMAQPAKIIDQLCEFAQISCNRDQISEAIGRIRPERANAYKENVELSQFYETVKSNPYMKQLGYASSI